MSDANKSYRIKANISNEQSIFVNLKQDYETFDILSINVLQKDLYKLHSADYGVIVGRVVANGNFGVPNAKISVFIERNNDFNVTQELEMLYPYINPSDKNRKLERYNLLPDNKVSDCHQIVGTFPNKTYMLDNGVLMDIFDEYYRFTCRTNDAGDYIICGVPVGNHTLHMDLDISDCGILSQKPRDFVYKGYTIEQFENPNKFKSGTDYNELSQVFTQDQTVNVIPFWGNESEGESIGITRADINVNFRFEPTCVFIGSIVSDNSSNGISRKCIPTNQMGAMDELVTGEGTIEMIRKTQGGNTEEFQIKGTELINTNGVWCYQIPMNLDYMMTDEYGNMVPTDDPEKGIPTRTRVRFRMSMNDSEMNVDNYHRGKVLVPNYNSYDRTEEKAPDYNFGTNTKDESYRDLLWNKVYTVKSYIPRFQKSSSFKTERFTGIKHCNIYGQNNPMPYNNIRIKLPFMFTIVCALVKTFIRIVYFINKVLNIVYGIINAIGTVSSWFVGRPGELEKSLIYVGISDSLCPDMENWYFAPGATNEELMKKTLARLMDEYGEYSDRMSIDTENTDSDGETACITSNIDYLISCIEMNLAKEYKVINFDFYNDWINGVIYLPRFMRYTRPKRTYFFKTIKVKEKVRGCLNDRSIFAKNRKYYQQCSLSYSYSGGNLRVTSSNGCSEKGQKCHKKDGTKYVNIFNNKEDKSKSGGIVNEFENMNGLNVYYLKPYDDNYNKRVLLYATDIVLLGSLNSCDIDGIPQFFKYLSSSTYIMPTNLALTTMNDEAYIYTREDGTVCAKSRRTSVYDGVSISRLTYEDEKKATSSSNDPIEFNEEGDDLIPVTEAAGISWNYTGPGQEINGDFDAYKALYYPGGHFLGISCINSQTNIKSCLNLARICEFGSTESQRKEIITGFNEDGEPIYSYIAPNGFISKDEIVDEEARSMFATLNSTKLKTGARIGEERIYDYSYIRPNNFDGSFYKFSVGEEYNREIDTQTANELETDESGKTYMRSIEATSSDYLKFRFGGEKITERFLTGSTTSLMLPQYENSYYFYFGLRNGSTAIDEFNKQFFSVCEGNILSFEPQLILRQEFTICSGGTIYFSTLNLGDIVQLKLDDEVIEYVEGQDSIKTDKVGIHKVSVLDDDGVFVESEINLGEEYFEFAYTKTDFRVRTSEMSESDKSVIVNSSGRCGGYVRISKACTIGGEACLLSVSDGKISIEKDEIIGELYIDNVMEIDSVRQIFENENDIVVYAELPEELYVTTELKFNVRIDESICGETKEYNVLSLIILGISSYGYKFGELMITEEKLRDASGSGYNNSYLINKHYGLD